MQQLVWHGAENSVSEIKHRVLKVTTKTYGVHMVGSLYTKRQGLLTDGRLFIRQARAAVKRSRAHVVGESAVQFEPLNCQQSGYSAVLILAESHITVHTWPELGLAEIDVYLCNVMQDNRTKCQKIFRDVMNMFEPTNVFYMEIRRPVFEPGTPFQTSSADVTPGVENVG